MKNTRKMTITEAMAELKLIDKKIQKKSDFILSNISSSDIVPDSLEGKGKERIKSEFKSISDLNKEYINIKKAINIANSENNVTINNNTMTIQEWLNWKAYVYEREISLLNNTISLLNKKTEPRAYKDEDGNSKFEVITYNVDDEYISKEIETIMDSYERLDGQLSLKNATIVIEF